MIILNNKAFSKNKIQIFMAYVFAFFTILECNSMYVMLTGHYNLIIQLMWNISLVALLIYAYPHLELRNKIYLYNFLLIFGFVVSLFFIYEFFYYPSFPKNYIGKLLVYPIILIIYFYSLMREPKKCTVIFNAFENIMIILAIISIVFWILDMMGITPHSIVMVNNWYGDNTSTPIPTYFHIGFIVGNGATWFGTQFPRNSGIFTEPSMFSYPLNVALLIELFLKKNKLNNILNKKTIILFLVILSTASTTGIFFSILSIFCALIFKYKNPLHCLYLIFVPIIYFILKVVVLNKINANQNDSYSVRLEDIESGIKAWKKHILLGNGIGNVDSIKSYFNEERFLTHHAGISAGFTTILAFGGIYLGLFYILPLVCSLYVSSSLFLFATFTLIPLIYVAVQDRFICIIIISYIWAKIIWEFTKNYYVKFKYIKK